MRPIVAFLTSLWLLVTYTACAPMTPKSSFAYADEAFAVTVRGTFTPAAQSDGTPRPFAAQITVGEPKGGDPTLRDLSVAFTSPDTLAGITVTATLTSAPDGTVKKDVTFSCPSDYGQVQETATGREFNGLLRFAEYLLPIGDVVEVSPKAPDGSFSVTRRSGEREAVFTFPRDGMLPTSVRVRDTYGVAEMWIAVL